MKTNQEIIEVLERLSKQADMAAQIVRISGTVDLSDKLCNLKMDESTPRTFEVGDFIVTDRQWTKC